MGVPAPIPARHDLKLAMLLGLVAGLSVIALMPYLMQVMPERLARVPIPLPWLAAVQALQTMLLIGALSFCGLRMGHRVGLGAPLLQRGLNRRPLAAADRPRPGRAMVLGAAGALVVLAAMRAIDPFLPEMLNPPAQAGAGTSALNGLLASFYGGIVEELLLRLFLMTLLVWIVARVRGTLPGPAAYWTAIVLAALLFGAGHLPAAHHIWGLDAVVVLRTVGLNAVIGIVCGWLYWRQGLEMAMLAHFSADIVLHILAPLLGAAP
ncbi:CPBP family glutamic-type intramembrane protease [Pseudoxanthomonas putridarboris]|uniref:CPBP family glutamic-type intramembrane protease n=1 Tax=Pseudoxanthomonas putridarboris TaxID=752605 RepID=A0ABU9J221_9GAMM